MKISDLIDHLFKLLQAEGDLDVYVTAPCTDSDAVMVREGGVYVMHHPDRCFKDEIETGYPSHPILYLDSCA